MKTAIPKKVKRPKRPSLPSLVSKADKLTSLYIRQKYADHAGMVKCCTRHCFTLERVPLRSLHRARKRPYKVA